MFKTALICSVASVASQQVGDLKENHHLPLSISRCTRQGCVEEPTTVTLDANWRWLHETGGYDNCYENGKWNTSACSNAAECASKCALEGVSKSDWSETYGISERDGGVRVKFKTGSNTGSRFYMLDPSKFYKQFQLLNREFTFDVDVSTLPCGMNGAVYFSEMPSDGDRSSSNPAGSAFGTGYCDAQCPADVKFISDNSGTAKGAYGSCCAEMDLWEANAKATAFTAHPCKVDQLYRCKGAECKTICDMPGCDFNSYRMGAQRFYGPGPEYSVNTLKPFTLVTQFITSDGTDDGDLSEIRRFYVQDGKEIHNSPASIPGLRNQSVLSDEFCALDKQVFGDINTLAKFGGMKQMGEAIGRGMTLVLSLWDDGASNMHWLDSKDPVSGDSRKPGVLRGPCPTDVGNPDYVRSHSPDAFVDYYNFKYGNLGSTVTLGQPLARPEPHPAPPQVPAPAPAPAPSIPPAGKCCYGGCAGDCQGSNDWCSESRDHCEGACSGEWCPASMLGQVKRHRQLRGKDHMFIQKLLRFSLGRRTSKEPEPEQDNVEL